MNIPLKLAYCLIAALVVYLVTGLVLVIFDIVFNESMYVDNFFRLLTIDALFFVVGFFIETRKK
jgi:hypothetical protein